MTAKTNRCPSRLMFPRLPPSGTAKGSVEKYPRTDEEWKELRRRTIQVMEGANLLLIPGRHVAKPGDPSDPRIELPPDQIERIRARWREIADSTWVGQV